MIHHEGAAAVRKVGNYTGVGERKSARSLEG